ncbi:hypothetical protein [Enterocloster asparagiformis]|uniref:hypothetical protein n=1 Tax=Enterocloster asparagiformis TaxID=333367 RepID=UPI0004674C2A|nr:hypothetical protein [Enterocloster asparagiformis]
MITVRGRQLVIPRDENQIGTTYDDNSEVRHFLIDRVTAGGMDLSHLNFRLDLEYQGEKKDTSLLDVEVREDSILLTWTIPHSCLTTAGTVWIAIRGYDDNGTVKWATNRGTVYVENTIDTPGNIPKERLTELEQLEQQIEGMKQSVDDSIIKTEESALKADVAAQNANNAAENAASVRDDLLKRAANGEFKGDTGATGPQGPKGESGVTAPTNGIFSLYLDGEGNLYAEYQDQDSPPTFHYDSDTGNLYYVFDEKPVIEPTNVGGVPNGGAAGQVLEKASNNDYDVAWSDREAGVSFEVRDGDLIAKYGKEN